MTLLKTILARYIGRKAEEFNVSTEDWNQHGNKIIHKDVNNKSNT
jgi:hypothetical protein